MRTLARALGSMLAVAAVMIGSPLDVGAQECTAEVLPAQIDGGANAVRLTVSMSSAVGEVAGLEAPSDSGIEVASPRDLPRSELAAGAPQAPITAGPRANSWIVWVNTSEARPGTHALTFVGSEGRCTASVTVRSSN